MIKGILIDFGGTIDSNGIHWFNAFREGYSNVSGTLAQPSPSGNTSLSYIVPNVPDELLREAYVHTERTLGQNSIITPETTFYQTLQIKLFLQAEYLQSKDIIIPDAAQNSILDYCYNKVIDHISAVSKPILNKLSARFPIVLVTNFYGNMHAVLDEFGLKHLFKDVIESSVVGVRKPDPEIFRLGVRALDLKPQETVMIGDSPDKDIIPAQSIGCHTIWLRVKSRYENNYKPDHTIASLSELHHQLETS